MKKSKYNILITSADLNLGGEQLSTIGLAEGLVDRGHNVYYMSSGGPLEEDVKARGIKFIWGPTHLRLPHGILKGAYHMRQFLKGHAIDVIQAAAPLPTLMAFFATRPFNSRPVLIWHNRGVKKITYPIVGKLFNYMIDNVISISDYERDKLIMSGLSSKKASRVHHGVFLRKHLNAAENEDVGEIKKSIGVDPEAPVVGIVSRLSYEKGHCYLIDATPRILSEFPNAMIVFVGGGFMEDKLRAQVKSRQLEEKIIFLGSRRDVDRMYKMIDVLVHPSLWESLCNVLLEAMFMAKPIAATNGSAIPEVIKHGETGLLFPPADREALADCVIRLLKDRDLAGKLGQAAKTRADTYFTVERQMDELEELYSKLIASKNNNR